MDFKKINLKSGMIVKTRAGELFCYFACKDNQSFLFNENEMIPISFYNNDLMSNKSKQEDIVEVCEIKNNFLSNFSKAYLSGNKVYAQKTDWSNVSIDSKVLFFNGKDYERGYFAKYENEGVYIFKDGATSWSNDSDFLCLCANDVILCNENNTLTVDSNEYRDIEGFSRYKINIKGDIIRKEYIRNSEFIPEKKVPVYRNNKKFLEVILYSDKGSKKTFLLIDLIAKAFPKK